jgi:hypothetical protein
MKSPTVPLQFPTEVQFRHHRAGGQDIGRTNPGAVINGGRVETADGSGSFLANYETTNGVQSLVLSDFQAGSVPEPGVMVVIAAGMMAMLPRYRRRK